MNKQIDIKELLDWYMFAGVTETCGDEVCLINENIIEKEKAPIQTLPLPPQQTSISTKSIVQSNASKNAKDVCDKANTIDELFEILLKFEGFQMLFV
jgi:hypothetical protein